MCTILVTLHHVHSTSNTTPCVLYYLHYIKCTIQFTLYHVHWTFYTTPCALHYLHYTTYTIYFTIHWYGNGVFYTVYIHTYIHTFVCIHIKLTKKKTFFPYAPSTYFCDQKPIALARNWKGRPMIWVKRAVCVTRWRWHRWGARSRYICSNTFYINNEATIHFVDIRRLTVNHKPCTYEQHTSKYG